MKKKKPSFFRQAQERCAWVRTRPELFPELYGDVRQRMPDHRVLEHNELIMRELLGMMDLESRRVGTPKADGSIYGLSEKALAIRTGRGDPRVTGKHGHWRGRRVLQRRIRRLREGRLLTWGKPEWWEKKRACNPRYKIEKGPHAGEWCLKPSVRIVTMTLLERLQLNKRYAKEVEGLRQRRALGLVPPVIDVELRRARDRVIKRRWRAAVAAKTVRKLE